MRNTNLKAIACKISRGGFSDERVFAFDVNGAEYSGVASRTHMWGENKLPLEAGEPPAGEMINGYVAARILDSKPDGSALVSVPDGGVLEVPIGQLLERPAGVGQQNVFVGS